MVSDLKFFEMILRQYYDSTLTYYFIVIVCDRLICWNVKRNIDDQLRYVKVEISHGTVPGHVRTRPLSVLIDIDSAKHR